MRCARSRPSADSTRASSLLLAFGGAGPLHAAAVATELGIREVIIPLTPGGFSAWGMLHARAA